MPMTEMEMIEALQNLGVTPWERWCAAASVEYEKAAPKVAEWVEAIYLDLMDGGLKTTVADLRCLLMLRVNGAWMGGNAAQNHVYHHLDRMGRDTTGWSDF